jgi:hypothetical protein
LHVFLIEHRPEVAKHFAYNKQRMALALLFIVSLHWIREPPLHLSPHCTLDVLRDFPLIIICDRHLIPDYIGTLVAEDADDPT